MDLYCESEVTTLALNTWRGAQDEERKKNPKKKESVFPVLLEVSQ